MEIKYGLISCDSHAQPDKDAFTSRMSKAKWGDAIPHLMETTDKAHMAVAFDRPSAALGGERPGGGQPWGSQLPDGDE